MEQQTKRTRNYSRKTYRTRRSLLCLILSVSLSLGIIDNLNEFIPNKVEEIPKIVKAKESSSHLKGEHKKNERSIIPMKTISDRLWNIVNTVNSSIEKSPSYDELLETTRPYIRNEFKWKQVKSQYDEMVAAKNVVCDPKNITKISNLTETQANRILEGTWLEGKGQQLLYFERKHHINAFFIYAGSTLESGPGDSPKAWTSSNFYGLSLDRDWDDWEDCTAYWADMVDRLYVSERLDSVESISYKYCPPTPEDWTGKVTELMNSLYNKTQPTTVQKVA